MATAEQVDSRRRDEVNGPVLLDLCHGRLAARDVSMAGPLALRPLGDDTHTHVPAREAFEVVPVHQLLHVGPVH